MLFIPLTCALHDDELRAVAVDRRPDLGRVDYDILVQAK